MKTPQFGKTIDRTDYPDGRASDIIETRFRRGQIASREHRQEETIKAADKREAAAIAIEGIELVMAGEVDDFTFSVVKDEKTNQPRIVKSIILKGQK